MAPLPLPAARNRRPGERREPLSLEVPKRFVEVASNLGLGLATAVEIAFEYELVKRDLHELTREHQLPVLIEHAETARLEAPIAAPYARYLRSLTRRRRCLIERAELEQPLDLPLRFFPRVLQLNAMVALCEEGLSAGLTLERAALCSGRTMSEYVLLMIARR